jgi:hypothetical protein
MIPKKTGDTITVMLREELGKRGVTAEAFPEILLRRSISAILLDRMPASLHCLLSRSADPPSLQGLGITGPR